MRCLVWEGEKNQGDVVKKSNLSFSRIYNTQQNKRSMNIIEMREKVRSTYDYNDLSYTGYYEPIWNSDIKDFELRYVDTEPCKVQEVAINEFIDKVDCESLAYFIQEVGLFTPEEFSTDFMNGKISFYQELRELALRSTEISRSSIYLEWAQRELDKHVEYQIALFIADISSTKNYEIEFTY